MHTEPCLTVWSSDCQVSWMCRKNIGDYTTPWPTRGVRRLTYITMHLDTCKVQWLTFHAECFNLCFNKLLCKDNYCQLLIVFSICVKWMNENGALVEWYWQRKTKVFREKVVSLPLQSQQIPCGLAKDWTWAYVVRGQWLTMWIMVWLPYGTCCDICYLYVVQTGVFFFCGGESSCDGRMEV